MTISWTHWEWQPTETVQAGQDGISNASHLEREKCRLDVWQHKGQWHWSAVYPNGQTGIGIAGCEHDAREMATENANAQLAEVI